MFIVKITPHAVLGHVGLVRVDIFDKSDPGLVKWHDRKNGSHWHDTVAGCQKALTFWALTDG